MTDMDAMRETELAVQEARRKDALDSYRAWCLIADRLRREVEEASKYRQAAQERYLRFGGNHLELRPADREETSAGYWACPECNRPITAANPNYALCPEHGTVSPVQLTGRRIVGSALQKAAREEQVRVQIDGKTTWRQ